MMPKLDKQMNEVISYRPLSLLPVMSKLYETLLLKIERFMEEKCIIPLYQFSFRNKYRTIDQIHRITNLLEKPLEESKICLVVFLGVAQAFDKVWH